MCYSFKRSKRITITNAFQKILNKSKHKPNKYGLIKAVNFIIAGKMKPWLEKSDIKMYLTHNERKSVNAERFIRTFKHKIYKFTISKNCILIN